jgi:uncharacterized phage-associated protein
MNRSEAILAALAASGGAEHSPVQVQKLLFLMDRKLGDRIGAPHFDFQPYDFGPFAPAVYRELEAREAEGEVEIITNDDLRRRKYRLTPAGQTKGDAILAALDPNIADYLRRLSAFVRSLSFAALVSAVYKAFPEMKANSIFQD